MKITCFLAEHTDTERLWLRRYGKSGVSGCPGPFSCHDAKTLFGETHVRWNPPRDGRGATYSTDESLAPPHDDPRWPRACDCGYVFDDADHWQLFGLLLYRRVDGTGELFTDRDAPPGAMWNADWLLPAYAGPDGKSLMVQTPGGPWAIDSGAKGGGRWTRTGDAPRITARPSILMPGYHGFLTDGVLEDC